MLFFTIVCANHLALASILRDSIKRHMPEHKFVVCMFEKEIPHNIQSFGSFDDVILAKDIGFKNFNQTIFKYNQYEASGACKGQLFRYMLQAYPSEDKFVLLDADTQVFSPFTEVQEALKTNSIVITPHIIQPPENLKSVGLEQSFLQSGIFNTGFLAINRSKTANTFVDWWAERLEHFSYTDPPRGLYNEQRWIDHVPVYFDQVLRLKHPGYNVAKWNFFERTLTEQNGKYFVNGLPLRFIHFSGFINNTTNSNGHEIIRNYKTFLKDKGHGVQCREKWSYDYFDDQRPIKDQVRTIYKNNPLARAEIIDPFKESKRTFNRYK
ncbi:glycosyltransferase [Alkalihalobacillus sp. TS-13]|uniref:glycosyltransferase n=1 Tax=Alkalihalobacillus sp. TS-13 TaxID=2842455 RepID=UPI001C88365F|nr:glycosyltransferase [Alkalihalobacillus sp. TS-13]